MSNKQNDILVDLAIDIVAAKMEANPTIPEAARHDLEKEELRMLMLTEPTDIETEMDDDSGDEEEEEDGH